VFKKILIANRGEIALRIIRACRELNIKTVAVYSKADAESLHVRFADEAVCIGPARSTESYLNIPRIIGAAEITNADAIHPGYGFLAENAGFADKCADSNLVFLGPPSSVITKMGDKALAKQTMKAAGVPILPGSDGEVSGEEEALKLAENVGYPVILKASAGGGGKGMRVVNSPDEMSRSYAMAHAEAETSFNNGGLYLEKYLTTPRHIEVQVMGYRDGSAVAFGERDCSIQRRHQKLIEESPSPAITEALRQSVCATAVQATKSVGYVGAGTIEFLFDKGQFFFMEMNTRIQVEHPVTEMVSGVDLVKEQILALAGEISAPLKVTLLGHSIECRINAEDPSKGFMPSPGRIETFHVPGGPGVRVDTHAYAGYNIPPFYDSMIAKLIVHGRDRKEALQRMARALDEFIIEGVATTIPLHRKLVSEGPFFSGDYGTYSLEKYLREQAENQQ